MSKNTKRFSGLVTDVHVDDRRGHATITMTVSGETHHFWTNLRGTAKYLDSFFQPGETGWIEADPKTDHIEGYGK